MTETAQRTLTVACAVFFFAFATAVHAEEAKVFRMADGTYYHPASGTMAASEDALLKIIEQDSVRLISKETAKSPAPAPAELVGEAPKLFRMADGQFYHPGTGFRASTETELYRKIGFDPAKAAPSPVSSVDESKPPVVRAIMRAQEELKKRIEADKMANPATEVVQSDDFWRDVTLAVWNKKTDQMHFLTGQKNGTQLRLDESADVSVRRSNWINSEYVLTDPNMLVVAVRYPILKKVAAGYEVNDEVYSPYSSDLHLPEVVKEGEEYLNKVIDEAFAVMREKDVPSRAYKGQEMADVVDKDLIKGLLVIEHMDLTTLANNPKYGVEKVLATFGLNKENTYNFSRSSAGAFGAAQFMPRTYASFVNRSYLGLEPDFEQGMKDHVNAVRAQAAYLDDALASLPSVARELGMDDTKVKEYLAASYNGGYAKVRTAIQIWDEQISGEYKPHEILARSRLFPETIQYVKKLRYALPVISAGAQLATSI